MVKYDLEVEKYVVHYGEGQKREFVEAEQAIEFGRKKMDEDVEVDIKQINVLVGWY